MNTFKHTINYILQLFLIAFVVSQLMKVCKLPSNIFVEWTVGYGIILFGLIKAYLDDCIFTKESIPFLIYTIWMIIGVIRGIYTVDNYWEVKFFTSNIICLSLPLFILIFRNPEFTLSFYLYYNKIIPIYLIAYLTGYAYVATVHFQMGPVFYLLASFLFLIPSYKWKIATVIVLLLMASDVEARSQLIKACIAFGISIVVVFDRWIPRFLIQIGAFSFYILAIVLLYLGITGKYNIFDHSDHSNTETYVNGKLVEKPIGSADTRTFIYVEVLTSAVNNDYIWIGRTPARGNDSPTFAPQIIADRGTGVKLERNMNEVCHPNIFTWLGLIGMILYGLLYLQSTIMGLYYSNNIYIRYLAVVVAIHWALGWIENMNNFIPMNMGQWMVIGMCISPEFRRMSNDEFKIWFRSLFSWKMVTDYHKVEMMKRYFKYKALTNK